MWPECRNTLVGSDAGVHDESIEPTTIFSGLARIAVLSCLPRLPGRTGKRLFLHVLRPPVPGGTRSSAFRGRKQLRRQLWIPVAAVSADPVGSRAAKSFRTRLHPKD